jgi:hypothetical protein
MKSSLSRLWPLLLLLACSRQAQQTEAGGGAEAGPPGVLEARAVQEGPYVVRLDVLDRYLAFQKEALELELATLRELTALEAQPDDPDGRFAVAVQREAEARASLRQRFELTLDDVEALERITSEVMARRALAATSEEQEQQRELEQLAARLSEEDREQLSPQLERARKEQRELLGLVAERAVHGDANVDVVLARERELTLLWHRTVEALTARGSPAAKLP